MISIKNIDDSPAVIITFAGKFESVEFDHVMACLHAFNAPAGKLRVLQIVERPEPRALIWQEVQEAINNMCTIERLAIVANPHWMQETAQQETCYAAIHVEYFLMAEKNEALVWLGEH